MKFKIYIYILICFMFAGCDNPSRKELSKILEQTESLAIFSVPGRDEPQFYPSGEFNWDRLWEGMSEGGSRSIADVKESYNYLGPYLGALLFFIQVPVEVIVGGVFNAGQIPPVMKSRFAYILCNAFEGQIPGDQIAQRIHTNCIEKKPELDSQRIYWSDSECAEYRIASSGDKKVKMKGFYRMLDSSGIQMLLIIHGTDYGLTEGTMTEPVSRFFMILQAELIRTKDGKLIYRQEFNYKSTSHILEEWEATRGQLLKNEFGRACWNIGDMISDGLFGG